MPRKSSTPEVARAQRISYAVEAMSPREIGGKGLRPGQASHALMLAFGIAERTSWKDIAEAKKRLSDAFLLDVPGIKAELLEFYRGIMKEAREEGDLGGALKAAQALAKLTGADAPSKVEMSGTAGVLVIGPQEDE